MARQAGARHRFYGIVWPHISTVEEAYNAVAACRYPRLKTAKNYEPAGIRGDGPPARCATGACAAGYYAKADVWPLDPNGEIFCILQIEDMRGVDNLDKMLTEVKGVGAILIGEGDLGQELGIPRQYEHPNCSSRWRAWSTPARSTTSSSAIRMSRPATASASSRRAIAS
jgi:2-keto-3-deoxy-L-rhamnonate aldolase RhmA